MRVQLTVPPILLVSGGTRTPTRLSGLFIYEHFQNQISASERGVTLLTGVNLCQPGRAASCHHFLRSRRVKRSAFGLAWDDKGVLYRSSEKPSFNESPDRVQVTVRLESESPGFNR